MDQRLTIVVRKVRLLCSPVSMAVNTTIFIAEKVEQKIMKIFFFVLKKALTGDRIPATNNRAICVLNNWQIEGPLKMH